ncbi:uncharacterized protein [Notamacropus eugenii]|uniref:uncharacterized protein n=1 Tax=Notamacropus eugenii TaxID=9315 RepID=UPI003B681C01
MCWNQHLDLELEDLTVSPGSATFQQNPHDHLLPSTICCCCWDCFGGGGGGSGCGCCCCCRGCLGRSPVRFLLQTNFRLNGRPETRAACNKSPEYSFQERLRLRLRLRLWLQLSLGSGVGGSSSRSNPNRGGGGGGGGGGGEEMGSARPGCTPPSPTRKHALTHTRTHTLHTHGHTRTHPAPWPAAPVPAPAQLEGLPGHFRICTHPQNK